MDLIFDRGTILLKEPPERMDFTAFPEFLWDQRVEHFRAPAHCYWKILSKLEKAGFEVKNTAVAQRNLTAPWMNQATLRPYQEAALQAWKIAGRRGLIVLPTGSGKTNVAIGAIAQVNEPALCLVPTRVLMEQWHSRLKATYTGRIGVYGDGSHEVGEITIATYESAFRNITSLGNRFGLIIVDEVHHFGSGMRDEIFEMTTAKYRLGLTGTLPRDIDQLEKLARYIGPPVYELAISDLSGKFLAEFDLYSLHLDMTEEERRAYDSNMVLFRGYFRKFREACPEADWLDFVRLASQSIEGKAALKGLQVAKKATGFTHMKAATLASLLERHSAQRTLIFTADAETTYTISRRHLITPITSEIGRKERETAVARFKEGRIKAMVSCRVLNEGFDVPDAEVAIIVGGTHGEREHLQRIGRILRPSQRKKAVVYELICRNTIEVRQSNKRNGTIAARKTTPIFY